MLKKIGRWNDIPKESLPKLPKAGTVEIFRFTDSYYDPVANEGQPITTYATDITIPYFSKTKLTPDGDWIEIGMLSGVDKEQNAVISQEYRQRCQYSPAKNGGQLRITIGRSALDDAFYQYLRLASFVKNNPGRDESEQIILEYVDVDKIASDSIEKLNTKRKAMGIAANLNEDQLAEMAYILNLGKNLTPSQITNMVWSNAENDPEGFLTKIGDESAPYKARIAQGLSLEIVSLNPETSSIHWNDSAKGLLLKVESLRPEEIQSQYAEFAQSPEGKKVDTVLAAAIKKQAKKSIV